MAIAYILIALLVMAVNIDQLPEVIKLIVRSAFGLEAGYGAIISMAVQWELNEVYTPMRLVRWLTPCCSCSKVSHR